MPQIRAFRGVVYNKKKVGNIAKVVAPPYDVISKKAQDDLYRANPYNIIRLELGKIKTSDTALDNRYTRAGRFFESWIRNDALVRDEREAFYIYSQTYKHNGKTRERIGFFAAMGLDDEKSSKVLPHEKTLLAPKLDRLDLIRKVRANLSPIYVLYDDPGSRVMKVIRKACSAKSLFMDIRFEGLRNRAWRLDDPKQVRVIETLMSGKDIFIADGHHRYEVSRMYAGELAKNRSGKCASQAQGEAANYVMAYFVPSDEKMLTVLPAHRLIKDLGRLAEEQVLARLSAHFRVRKVAGLKAMMSRLERLKGRHAFGFHGGSGAYYLLELKDVKISDKAIQDRPKEWKRLDVAILHRFIFQHILGIRDTDDNVEFVKSPEETAALIDRGEYKAAFFLNATSVSEIKRVAKIGEKMPRKATYFFPKPITGVVIHKH